MGNQNQNQNGLTVDDNNGKGSMSSSFGIAPAPADYNPDSLSLDPVMTQPSASVVSSGVEPVLKRPNPFARFAKRADIVLAVALVLVVGGLLISSSAKRSQEANQVAVNEPAANYETQNVPLSGFAVTDKGVDLQTAIVSINGGLTINGEVVITPSLQPSSPKAGQLYYDQGTNLLGYYNGSGFVLLGADEGQVVQTLGTLSGQVGLGGGLATVGNQLVNAGVLSVGGAGGDIVLGSGLNLNNNILQNTGVLNLTSGTPNVTVADNGGGSFSVSVTGSGTGTVGSSGGTSGTIPVFTASQNIEDSIITQSGLNVTVGGGLNVTGSLTLGSALTVANGGTGAASLASNGVIVGNGVGALSSVVAGGAGLCLVSTAGAPTFAACPGGGGGGVTSLNSLTGALSIANASTSGSTVTIDDATAVAKGIASFNSTNFTVASGAVNTVQNINSGATPTFAGVNTNNITPSAALTMGISAQTALLQGSTTTITSSGVGNDIVLNSADTIELQDNTNVTGGLDVSGALAVGTGNAFQVDATGNVTASDIAANGGDITSSGALNITPGGTLTAGASSQTLTLQGNASTSLRATSGANTTVVAFTNPTANTTLNFPALSAGTYTVCTTAGNCAGAGVTLQSAYDNSTTPEIVLDATRGALTIRDNVAPLGANLLEVQNNGGGTTYLAVTASGVTVTGTATVTGNINSSGGALQTSGTTRVDGSGNLSNIGSLSLSGAISGGTSFSGSGNINTTGGVIQTNTTTRIDNSGNLVNIAAITATGSATLQGGVLTLGTNAQAGTVVLNDGSSNTGTLAVAALGQNTVYTLPDPAAGTATICISTGNCASAAGGVTTSGGTINAIPKFTGSQTIGDSIITDNGTTVTIGGTLAVNTIAPTGAFSAGAIGQTTTLQGSITTITSNGVGNDIILNSADTIELQDSTNVTGNLDISGTLTAGTGNAFQVDASGNVSAGTYNGQTISSTASFTGTVTVATGLTLTSGNLAVSSGNITASGNATLQGGSVTIGTTSQAGSIVLHDGNGQTATISIADLAGSRALTIPAATGSDTFCLQSLANCSGVASTLQSAYDNSTSPEIVLDATRGALTIRDNSTPLGANLVEVQNNGGGTTYFAVTTGGVSVTGTATATGNINSSGGALQTNGTTRVDNSGNLSNIGNLSLSGTISGGTTITGSGNINTSGGALQTAGTSRIDNSGNLINIGNITGTGAITVASAGAGNDVIIDGADEFIIQDAAVVNGSAVFNGLATFNADTDLVLADTENLSIASTVTATNSVNVVGAVLTNNTTSGTQQVALLQNAPGSGATEGLLVLDNADADTAVANGLQITSAAGGITTAVDVSDPDIVTALLFGLNDISGTNFSVTGGTGSFTSAGNATVQGGTVSVGTTSQAGILVLNDGSSNTGTLQTAALGQNTVYNLPDPGTGTVTICVSTGNCAGSGTGVTTSGGSTNRLAKFTAGQNIENSTITDDGTNVTTTADVIVQGGDVTVGTSSQLASMILHDGNGQTTTLRAGDSAGGLTFILPTTIGATNQCLKQSGTGNQLVWDDCDGGGGGSTASLQTAYDNGNTISTTGNDIGFTLNSGQNFSVQVADGGTGSVSLSRADGAGTSDPAQLLLLDNLDATRPVTAGIKLQAAAGGLTTAIDASDAEIGDALSVGANNIVGTTGNLDFTNFDVVGSTGAITAGLYNGQTITSTASFTGTVTVATDLTLTAGDIAVNGGNITSSGALSIDPGGAFTAGATGQTSLFRGSITTISSNGVGNDIILNSADTIELQDSSNVTGNLDVSGTFNAGTGNAFQVDASGNVVAGTYNTNTFTSSNLQFGAAATATVQAAASQALTLTSNAASTWSTSAGDLTVQGASSLNLRATSGNIVLGTSDTTGTLLVVDIKTDAGDPTGTDGAIYYNSSAGTFRCYQAGAWANCITASGGFVSLQNAYDNGNTITTDASGDIAFTLNNQNFTVGTAAGGTGSTAFSLADGANPTPASQLVLIHNYDTNQVLAAGLKVTSAAGGITTAIDASGANITNAISIGANAISGTNFSVTGGGLVTAGTYNGQTISSAASFTGTVTVATDLTLTAGDIAVNGGNITSSGALSIDPGGAFTAGATGQTTTLRGSTTSISSNGAGNDITLNSADQIILNAGSSVELQDNTNVSGSLDVSGTLASGTADAFQVDASGNVTAGTYNTNTFTSSSLQFGAAATATIQSAGSQALTITGNAASTWSTSSGSLTVQAASSLNLRATSGNVVLGTSDTTGTLLVVDTKTDAGDPTGADGAIYYNSNAGKFRCYQNSGWADCITTDTGVTTVGAFSASPQTNGATIAGNTITFGPADATTPGMVGTGAQTFGGAKTFASNVTVQGTGGLVFNTGAGGDITFANNEKIDNDTNGTINLSADSGAVTLLLTGTAANINNSAGTLTLNSFNDTLTIDSSDTTLSATGLTTLNLGTNTSINSGGSITLDATSTVIIPDADSFQSNDVSSTGTLTLTSAASSNIVLNSAGTIELQDNTNVTGNLDVSGTLSVGTANAFQVSAAGVITLAGSQTKDITTAGAATATNLTVQPGDSSAANGTGATSSVKGGDQTSSTCGTSCVGGSVAVQGGNATGGAGTRNGGNVSIEAGTGSTSNGVINIGTATSANINIGKNTGGSTTLIDAGSGGVIIQANGSSVGLVQVGAGGAGTATPDYLALDVKSTTGDPAGGAEGYMYYNTFDNKYRCYQNAGWTDCITTDTGVTTVASFSGSSQANGANITGNTITFGPADGTNPGMVSTGSQTFAGDKTFSGNLIVQGTTGLTFNTGAGGDITFANGEKIDNDTNGTLNLQANSGALIVQLTGTAATLSNSAGNLTIDSASGRLVVAAGDFLSTSVAGVAGAAAGDIWYDSTAGKYKINEAGTTKTLCNLTDLACGAGATTPLQTSYNDDVDGSDAIIALTTADDSVIIRNPAASGTDSGYVLGIDQLNTGAVDGLRVSTVGTGLGQLITLGNTAGTQTNGVLIDRNGVGGTTTNGINVTNTAGTLTNGLAFTGTIGVDINRGSGSLSLNGNSGITLAAGGSTKATISTTDVTLASNIDLLLQGATAYISNPQGQTNSESFGLSASVTGSQALAVGASATAGGDGTAIGKSANAGAEAVSVGQGTAAGTASIVIGNASNSGGFADSIVIGGNTTATASNQLILGGTTLSGNNITQAYLGAGVTSAGAATADVVLQATGGNGTNIGGADFTLAGGRSTGNAAGGAINFQVNAPGASGAGLNSLATVLALQGGSSDTATFTLRNASGTQTNGVIIDRNVVGGTTTNGLNITNTAGTLTNGLAFTGTIGTDINRGSGSLSLNGASGITLGVGGSTKATVGANNLTLATNIDLLLQGATAFISNTQGITNSEFFGSGATFEAGSTDSVTVVGAGSKAGDRSVSFGASINNTANDAVAVGYAVNITSAGAIAIGSGSTAGSESIGLGVGANAGTNSIALGAYSATTASNQLVIGSNDSTTHHISQVVIGSGVTDTTPNGFTLQATSGSGTNIAGASATFAGGQGTGTGNGGSINFQIADPGTSGASLNSLATVLSLSGVNGAAALQNTTDSTTGFQVQKAGSSNRLLTVDTSNNEVELGTLGASGINGKLVFNTTNASNFASTIAASGSQAANIDYTLPTALASTGDCLKAGTVSGASVPLTFGTCSAGGGVTTVGAFSGSSQTNGANITGSTITFGPADGTNPGMVSTGSQTFAGNKTFTGQIIQNSDSASAFTLMDSTATYNNLTFDSSTNHLKVYDHAAPRTAYVDIYYAGSTAVIAASTGVTQIGNGTGDVNVSLTNNGERFNFAHTGTNATSSDIDFLVQRNLTGTTNNLQGAVFKVEDLSTFTSGSSASDVLSINQNNTSATGNLIVARLGGGSNDKFKVSTAGTVTVAAGQSYTSAGALTVASAAATALTVTSNAASTWSTTTGNLTIQAAGTSTLALDTAGAGTVAIANTNATTVAIATNATAHTVNIANGGAVQGVTVGSTNSTSSLTLQAGTGNLSITTQGGTLGIGTNAVAQTINIGNATGATVVNIKAGTGNVTIGTSDATGTLLVLDDKTGAGDPTGTNGAMYYNSSEKRFKCYENSAWKECTHRTVVRLTADQTNVNGTANTMEDVTGLSWAAVSGTMYNFSCNIYYTSAATTTGSRWAMNGPATTALMYQSEYTLTATTSTRNAMVQAYDSPAASNASSAAGGNLAVINGYILPSANGTIIVRHASEVISSTITAKAGSTCEYW